MSKIGKLNTLTIVKKTTKGAHLDGEHFGEIILPTKFVPEDCKVGDTLEVFIYPDSEDNIIATTEKPYAMAGEYALLEVISDSSIGAFLNWGLPKDLLVPFREQMIKMEEGRSYVVYIFIDDDTNRIIASSKLDDFLDREPAEFTEGQEVDLFIFKQTDLGYKAIIDNTHQGVLYKNEVFQPLQKGQKIKGYIRKLRDDGKIDLILHKPGYEKVDAVSKQVLDKLQSSDGFIDLVDKSSAGDIYRVFGISKKTYKKAIGALYKARLITIEENGIRLVSKDQ